MNEYTRATAVALALAVWFGCSAAQGADDAQKATAPVAPAGNNPAPPTRLPRQRRHLLPRPQRPEKPDWLRSITTN